MWVTEPRFFTVRKKKLPLGKTIGGKGGCSIGAVLKLEITEWAYVYVTFLLSKSICLLFTYPFLIFFFYSMVYLGFFFFLIGRKKMGRCGNREDLERDGGVETHDQIILYEKKIE